MLNLTREEKLVLIFVIACFIIGSGVSYYKKTTSLRATLSETKGSEAISEIALSPRNNVKVNINTAGFKELIKLRGIGVKIAERILDYRFTNGSFFYKEDLMKVKGIGKAKFDIIKDKIIAE